LAWAEAEAALPKGMRIGALEIVALSRNATIWQAIAAKAGEVITADAPTPAAALRALAEKLREH
jgi:hypothetical protein